MKNEYCYIVKRLVAKTNLEKYEKLILKKIKIYQIYDVSKTENADSDSNLKDLFCLFYIFNDLEMKKRAELRRNDSIKNLLSIISANYGKYLHYGDSDYSEKCERIKKLGLFFKKPIDGK